MVQLELLDNSNFHFNFMENIDDKYDELNKIELERRLKRPATSAELINSDNDSDLVNEVMWRLLKDLDSRLRALEKDK